MNKMIGELKDLVRPPFANYDIVVYFGGGLFVLPFIQRYIIQPTKMEFPKFQIDIGSNIASETISILGMIFFVYVIGHIISFMSSHIVEKSIDRYLGKISTAILISSISSERTRNTAFRAVIWNRIKTIRYEKALFVTTIRTILQIPVIPFYLFMFFFGVFGYYNTRITPDVMQIAKEKYGDIVIPGGNITIKSKWFKPLEYYVINNFPAALNRMYNYLVIAGLFRTLCIVFLFSSWMSLYYLSHFILDDHWILQGMMGHDGYLEGIQEFFLMSILYVFCFYSYIKFQRRYAEEVIMAFVFSH